MPSNGNGAARPSAAETRPALPTHPLLPARVGVAPAAVPWAAAADAYAPPDFTHPLVLQAPDADPAEVSPDYADRVLRKRASSGGACVARPPFRRARPRPAKTD